MQGHDRLAIVDYASFSQQDADTGGIRRRILALDNKVALVAYRGMLTHSTPVALAVCRQLVIACCYENLGSAGVGDGRRLRSCTVV